ncbi:cytosine/purine/uracil/thiamine/allantoin permease family protein [Klebsiella aerogenes]|nr:cytosine/purine/uracil/thiamine/allantoin permease family protein [Klebsiella aerogenes]
MTVGVLAAALSQGKLVGHEVDYIVGLGGTGAIATLLYLSIAFGKLTINTLNAYGSLMCLATVYSCGKQRVRVSQSVRLLGAGDDYYPGDRYRDYRATLFPVGV